MKIMDIIALLLMATALIFSSYRLVFAGGMTSVATDPVYQVASPTPRALWCEKFIKRGGDFYVQKRPNGSRKCFSKARDHVMTQDVPLNTPTVVRVWDKSTHPFPELPTPNPDTVVIPPKCLSYDCKGWNPNDTPLSIRKSVHPQWCGKNEGQC